MPVLSHQPSREWRHKHERDSVDDVPRYRPPDRRVDHVLRRRRKGWCRGEPSLRQRGGAGRRRLHPHLRSRRGAGAPAGRAMALTPDAVQVSSEEGELLSAARDGAGWHEQGSVGASGAGPKAALRPAWGRHPRRVASQRGPRRRRRCGVAGSSDGADRIRSGDKTNSQVSLVPTSQDLDCQACGRATDHQFKIHESVPAAAWTGQPIWECRVCGSARYGPSLE